MGKKPKPEDLPTEENPVPAEAEAPAVEVAPVPIESLGAPPSESGLVEAKAQIGAHIQALKELPKGQAAEENLIRSKVDKLIETLAATHGVEHKIVHEVRRLWNLATR